MQSFGYYYSYFPLLYSCSFIGILFLTVTKCKFWDIVSKLCRCLIWQLVSGFYRSEIPKNQSSIQYLVLNISKTVEKIKLNWLRSIQYISIKKIIYGIHDLARDICKQLLITFIGSHRSQWYLCPIVKQNVFGVSFGKWYYSKQLCRCWKLLQRLFHGNLYVI